MQIQLTQAVFIYSKSTVETSEHCFKSIESLSKLFHDGGPYDIKISLLIFRANQWTCFYIVGISIMKNTSLHH